MYQKRIRVSKSIDKNANVLVPPTIETEFRTALATLSDFCPSYAYLKSECFSKYVSSDTDPAEVRRQRAVNKWLSVEQQNSATNDRLLTVSPDYNILPRVHWSVFLDKLRAVVESIIGLVPPEDVTFNGGFSGGASTSRLRDSAHPALKLVGEADVTPRAMHHAVRLITECEAWWVHGKPQLNEVPGNILFTVPKAVDVDRCAAKEPDLNMFMQRGVGGFFRNRLRRFGVDLNDQSRNRDLARLGSLDGSLATLDLSSASDSVTRVFVDEVLPIHWSVLLNDLRSPVTLIDGEEHINEMFSSMGNGFTFELESLLFYSVARTVAYFRGVSGVISVYGDDIIVPSTLASDLMFVLSFLGFYPNEDKTHVTGLFRESCGGHYYGGIDVTPFYLKSPIKRLSDLILLLNKIRRWSGNDKLTVLDPSLEAFWLKARNHVPHRLWGGRDLGSNSSLVTSDLPRDLMIPRKRRLSNGIGGYILSLQVGSRDSTLVDRTVDKLTFTFSKSNGAVWFVQPLWMNELHNPF